MEFLPLRLKRCFLILFCTVVTLALGQQKNIGFYRLNVSDGLSNVNVEAIYQDSHGFMWFGTPNGLNRYNGDQIETFYHNAEDPKSISNSVIWDILEYDEKLWFATDHGLNYYDSASSRFVYFLSDDSHVGGLNSNRVRCLSRDAVGNLWIGTDFGINVYNGKTFSSKTSQEYPILKSNFIKKMFLDSQGDVWVADNVSGLYKWEERNNDFEFLDLNGRVEDIVEDDSLNLWVGSSQGLYKIDLKTNTWKKYQKGNKDIVLRADEIFALHYSNFLLWIGTGTSGLSVYDFNTQRTTTINKNSNLENGLTSNEIWEISESKDGVIWLGTFRGGVNYLHYQLQNFDQYSFPDLVKEGISGSVRCFLEDSRGNFWYGLDGGGLVRSESGTNELTHYSSQENNVNSLNSNTIISLAEDSDGDIWIGTFYNGISRYSYQTNSFSKFPDEDKLHELNGASVLTILEDQNENIWLGTIGKGIYLYDRSGENLQKMYTTDSTSSDDFIWHIFEDSKQNIWVGTRSGLKLLDAESEEFFHYTHDPGDKSSLAENWVHVTYEDSNGNIWIGTHGAGINKFLPEQSKFQNFEDQKDLTNKVIYGIAEDSQGVLWLSSDAGLLSFDPKEEKTRSYSSEELFGANFNLGAHFVGTDNRLLFGNVAGYISISPCDIRFNGFSPSVKITGFAAQPKYVNASDRIYDPALNADTTLMILPEDNSVFIKFAALSYLLSSKNLYSYQLLGYDTIWSEPTTRSSVSFTNLLPGEYTFNVRASNNDGVWSNETARISFTIITPWWQTTTARTLFLLATVMTLFLILRWRTMYLEGQKARLKTLVNEQTEEIEDQNKTLRQALNDLKETQGQLVKSEKISALSQVVFNLLHELNSPLGAVKSGLELTRDELLHEMDTYPIQHTILSESDSKLFKDFVSEMIQSESNPFHKNKIEQTEKLVKELDEIGVTDKSIIEKLVSMECFLLSRSLTKVLNSPNASEILALAEEFIYKYRNIVNIGKSTQRSISILNSLKTYGDHKFDSFNYSISVLDSIESALEIIDNLLGEHIIIRKEYIARPYIAGNEALIEQVWINLISNAVHAMNYHGDLTIRVNQNNEVAIVDIVDEGPGIPKNLQDQIFEPFYTTKPLGEGRGIGLDIVNRVLTKHQGEVQLDSKPGLTVFSVKIPLSKTEK